MYEGAVQQQTGNNWLLNVADAGLNSLYVADCKALAKTPRLLNKKNDENELLQRAALYSDKVKGLWSDSLGIYLHRYVDNGESSYRLSPTLFYPMMAGIPSQAQADTIIKKHF